MVILLDANNTNDDSVIITTHRAFQFDGVHVVHNKRILLSLSRNTTKIPVGDTRWATDVFEESRSYT